MAISYHGAKTVYVWLLTSSILYKNTAYFGGGKMVYSSVLFIISPPPRIDAPGYKVQS